MKNRAKCKLCGSIIESLNDKDMVECQCGEISLYDGTKVWCKSKDIGNLVMVDDEGNEIVVVDRNNSSKPNRKELIDMLDEMVKNMENLPIQAMSSYINHYDFASSLLLISSILRAED